jgi:rSAM/selenodomain-associated transferase 1
MQIRNHREERIVLFCKYPEPGSVKTRLISHLGAEAAARLQTEMAVHVLDWMRACSKGRGCEVELRYLGADQDAMRGIFGGGVSYREQGNGDFGDRIARAFSHAFNEKVKRVLAIGADCPTVTARVIDDALDALKTHDAVVGPATDGGYYLIGLSKEARFLFNDMTWGTSEVLEKTLQRVHDNHLSLQLLEPMSDVDRPEDLAVWHAAKKNLPDGS